MYLYESACGDLDIVCGSDSRQMTIPQGNIRTSIYLGMLILMRQVVECA